MLSDTAAPTSSSSLRFTTLNRTSRAARPLPLPAPDVLPLPLLLLRVRPL